MALLLTLNCWATKTSSHLADLFNL